MEIITTDHITDDVKWIYKRASEDPRNRLQENYLQVPNALLYTIAYDNDRPIGTWCAMERKEFNGMVRIGSRYYWDTQPGEHFEIPRPAGVEALDQQTTILGNRDVFMSRDDDKPLRWKRMHRGYNSKSIYDWEFDGKNKYIVYPGLAQWIIWNGENRLCISHEDM